MRRFRFLRQLIPLRRASRCASGGVVVEFAIIALPFIALLVSSLAIALEYLVYSQIDYATQRAAREVRAGNVQIQNLSASAFIDTLVCPHLTLLPCASARVNAVVIADAAAWASHSPDEINPATAKWCPGGSADAVLLQVSFPTPFAALVWGASDSVQKYYTSSVAFRNDPFGSPRTGGC